VVVPRTDWMNRQLPRNGRSQWSQLSAPTRSQVPTCPLDESRRVVVDTRVKGSRTETIAPLTYYPEFPFCPSAMRPTVHCGTNVLRNFLSHSFRYRSLPGGRLSSVRTDWDIVKTLGIVKLSQDLGTVALPVVLTGRPIAISLGCATEDFVKLTMPYWEWEEEALSLAT
jgi:hypothetical protein